MLRRSRVVSCHELRELHTELLHLSYGLQVAVAESHRLHITLDVVASHLGEVFECFPCLGKIRVKEVRLHLVSKRGESNLALFCLAVFLHALRIAHLRHVNTRHLAQLAHCVDELLALGLLVLAFMYEPEADKVHGLLSELGSKRRTL